MLALAHHIELNALYVVELDDDGNAINRSRIVACVVDFDTLPSRLDFINDFGGLRERPREPSWTTSFSWRSDAFEVVAQLGVAGPTRVVEVRTEQDFRRLSYYTLCQLLSATGRADPIRGLPIAIERGEFKGELTTDRLGNFVAFI